MPSSFDQPYAVPVLEPVASKATLLLSLFLGLALLSACSSPRPPVQEVGYKNPATLEAAIKTNVQHMMDNPGSSDYSPGLFVTRVACTVGVRTYVSAQLFSCTVYTSDGKSFPTPVIVSATGRSFTNTISNQHTTPTPTTGIRPCPICGAASLRGG